MTKEQYDIIEAFERLNIGTRYDKEEKVLWAKGHIYQHGETNNLFLAYRHGVSFGRCYYA